MMMALIGLLAVLLLVGGAVSIVLVRGVLVYLNRRLALEERDVAVRETRAKSLKPPAAIPPDLMQRVLRWQDLDAQGSERKVLLDLYADLQADGQTEEQTWVLVRQHLPRELPDTDAVTERSLFVA